MDGDLIAWEEDGADGEQQSESSDAKTKDNMPLVIVGSLLLVGTLLFVGSK